MTGSFLTAEGVTRRFGAREALRGVSLTAQPGELLGLLGPNGAGKTTLLTILAGLASADSGTVTLDREPLTPGNQRLKSRVGLAPQELAVYPELTAEENLHFFGRLYGLTGSELRSRTLELLKAVGLADRATDRAGTFSGGMQRRLNLAVAIVHRPSILFLDEPTTGVDPQSRNHLFDTVRGLNQSGMTIVYTSHYMEEVQTLCPNVAILDHGRVIAHDAVDGLLMRHPSRVELGIDPPRGDYEFVQHLPGVTEWAATPGGFAVTGHEPAGLLAQLLAECQRRELRVTAVTVEPPTLERVFLGLTGTALRD